MQDRPMEQPRKAQWAWVFFEKDVPLTEEMQEKLNKGETVKLEVLSKACNMSWNVQPENPVKKDYIHIQYSYMWNLK
jgi:hypothetical protein